MKRWAEPRAQQERSNTLDWMASLKNLSDRPMSFFRAYDVKDQYVVQALFMWAFLFYWGSLDGVMRFLPTCGRCRLVLPLTAGQEESQTQHLLASALLFEMPCACFQ